MTLAKRMRKMTRLHDEMEELFTRTFTPFEAHGNGVWSPAVDVREHNGDLIVTADLPGVNKADVQVSATEEAITLEGRTLQDAEVEQEGYYHRERHSGRFMRRIALPMAVDAGKARATFENGMMTVVLPKLSEAPKSAKIAIR